MEKPVSREMIFCPPQAHPKKWRRCALRAHVRMLHVHTLAHLFFLLHVYNLIILRVARCASPWQHCQRQAGPPRHYQHPLSWLSSFKFCSTARVSRRVSASGLPVTPCLQVRKGRGAGEGEEDEEGTCGIDWLSGGGRKVYTPPTPSPTETHREGRTGVETRLLVEWWCEWSKEGMCCHISQVHTSAGRAVAVAVRRRVLACHQSVVLGGLWW